MIFATPETETRSLVGNCLSGDARARAQLAKKTSPLQFVSPGDAPVLAFYGTKDELVPYRQAMRLAEALTTAGVSGRVELLVGEGHGWQGEEHDRTMKETFEFFDRHLKAPMSVPPTRQAQPPVCFRRQSTNPIFLFIASSRIRWNSGSPRREAKRGSLSKVGYGK